MTLKEFWDSKETLAIHCDTKEKAKKLCEAFDKMGKRFANTQSYLIDNRYEYYREQTCYNNKGIFSSLSYYIDNNIKVIKFDDIEDFKNTNNPVNNPSHYNDGKIEVIDLLIDLTFDKHCKIKEVEYQVDKLVCDDLIKLKEDLKENIKKVINNA